MMKVKITAGKKKPRIKYKMLSFEDTVGKTVEAVGTTQVEGAYGFENCILMFFTDNTKTGFVIRGDD
jgi:hypothetical protein